MKTLPRIRTGFEPPKNIFKDTDKDGAWDALDCQPRNPRKQGVLGHAVGTYLRKKKGIVGRAARGYEEYQKGNYNVKRLLSCEPHIENNIESWIIKYAEKMEQQKH